MWPLYQLLMQYKLCPSKTRKRHQGTYVYRNKDIKRQQEGSHLQIKEVKIVGTLTLALQPPGLLLFKFPSLCYFVMEALEN